MAPPESIAKLRAAHKKARDRSLSAEDRTAYLALRETFARAIVGAQGLSRLAGQSARRHFRIGIVRPVELQLGGRSVRAVTVDLSVGGFSALIDHAPRVDERVEFSLLLGGGEAPLNGRGKVVSMREHAINSRVSFAILDLNAADAERLEMFLFDLVLDRLAE